MDPFSPGFGGAVNLANCHANVSSDQAQAFVNDNGSRFQYEMCREGKRVADESQPPPMYFPLNSVI